MDENNEMSREANTGYAQGREGQENRSWQQGQQQDTPEMRNTVFIGKKSTMNYVLAVVTQFNSGLSEVTIKARGRAISKAVDVQQIVANKFIATLKNKDIRLSTESMLNEDGTKSRVSAIQIIITK